MADSKVIMRIVDGLSASPGIAIGPGYIFQSETQAPIPKLIDDAEVEIVRLQESLEKARVELKAIHRKAIETVGEKAGEIFNAHIMLLNDPELIDLIEEKIRSRMVCAEAAYYETSMEFVQALEDQPDPYLRGRAADIKDVCRRVVGILKGYSNLELHLSQPSIVIAEDLSPSNTVQFDRTMILGIFTAGGGVTSHTAILARALGIPAVVGAGKIPEGIYNHTKIILDGYEGKLILEPDHNTLRKYLCLKNENYKQLRRDLNSASKPAVTLDQKHVSVLANIGTLEDINNALRYGAEGIGLFRTELSYIDKASAPTEDELFHYYLTIFNKIGERPIVVRTLDIGGDKAIPYLQLPKEANPFLGNRGIRLCLERLDLFKPQLRAILRSGLGHDLRIMFPMVATVEEVRRAKAVLHECMDDLRRDNIAFNSIPKIGIMIEIPAAALCADQLSKEVDFFSIGTNDLAQYTMAVDRTNNAVAQLGSSLQPAVLRLVKQIIDRGHEAGLTVGMCGELAGEPLAIPILLGFGLDEFSMNPPAIPHAKEVIRLWDTKKAKKLAEQVVLLETPQEVEEFVRNFSNSNA